MKISIISISYRIILNSCLNKYISYQFSIFICNSLRKILRGAAIHSYEKFKVGTEEIICDQTKNAILNSTPSIVRIRS